MLSKHCEKLNEILGNASQIGKTTFALLCTERLQTCCWAFECKMKHDLQFVSKTISSIAESLKEKELGRDFTNAYQSIHNFILSSEEFSSPLAAQAKFSLFALEATLKVYETDNSDFCSEAATHVIDSIDNYEYFAWSKENLTSPFQGNDQNWLLQTELAIQIHQAHKVAASESIVNLRIENRLFTIPPAVE